MFVVVAYDIADSKRRFRVMKMLKGYGEHVQESVFECHLEPTLYRQMTQRLDKLIKEEEDNVRLYLLSTRDARRIQQIGVGRPIQLGREFGII